MADKKKTGTLRKLFGGGSKKQGMDGTETLSKKELKEQKKLEKLKLKESKKAMKASKKASKKGSKKKDKKKKDRVQAKRVNRGRVYINSYMTKKDGGGYKLHVKVFDARDMEIDQTKFTDVFMKVYATPDFGGSQKVSKTVKARERAEFDETFTWDITKPLNLDNTRLHIRILKDKGSKAKDFLGCLSFSLAEIFDPQTLSTGWFKLLDSNKGENQAVPFRVKKMKEIEELDDIYGCPTELIEQMNATKRALPAIPGSEVAPDPDAYEEPVSLAEQERQAAEAAVAAGPKVTIDDFTFIKVLGQGAFGKVLLAEKKGQTTDDQFAIKILSKEAVVEDDDVEATTTEKRILSKTSDCCFLTNMHACFQTDDRLYFVMEFITGGDLMFHIQKLEQFSIEQARFIAAEVAIGLNYLHDHGIIYRDLKLDNVMLSGDGHVKIADFGLCKENLWGAATTTTFCGTPGYIAPEIIKEEPYGASVDWWALGVMTYEMIEGDSPFDGEDEDEIFEEIQNKEIEFTSSFKDSSKEFVLALLDRDPTTRIGVGEEGRQRLFEHKFFAPINWDKLKAREVKPPYIPGNDKDPTANFDEEFTDMDIELSPPDLEAVADINQAMFNGFTFVGPKFGGAENQVSVEHPLAKYDWYQPMLPRKEAQQRLSGESVGSFIFRESGTKVGCYAISIQTGDPKCWRGVISVNTDINGEETYKVYVKNKFNNILDLLKHYHKNPICKNRAGDRIYLKDPEA